MLLCSYCSASETAAKIYNTFFLFLPNRSSVSVLIYFFYYQNVLELAVCDEDPLTKDDMQFTVLFNVARIRPGETIRETFALKSEVRTENTGRD